MDELISIIMPVYNAEKFLPRAIESVLNQTYKNIELILINDGSTDGSADVCRRYAEEDKRIKYYEQSNHGQGYTRARGINLANGEFVAFVDSDDRMCAEMYETMLKAMKHDHTDVCACQWNYELPNGQHTINNRIYNQSYYGIKTGVEFARYLYKYKELENGGYGYSNGVVVSPWNKLFRKELLRGFESNGYYGEDEEMNDFVYSQTGIKVSVIPEELYYWCQNLDSITNRPFSEKRWHFLKMLSERSRRYNDRYILGETNKLLCNIYIEYYFKGKEQGITPPHLQNAYLQRVA